MRRALIAIAVLGVSCAREDTAIAVPSDGSTRLEPCGLHEQQAPPQIDSVGALGVERTETLWSAAARDCQGQPVMPSRVDVVVVGPDNREVPNTATLSGLSAAVTFTPIAAGPHSITVTFEPSFGRAHRIFWPAVVHDPASTVRIAETDEPSLRHELMPSGSIFCVGQTSAVMVRPDGGRDALDAGYGERVGDDLLWLASDGSPTQLVRELSSGALQLVASCPAVSRDSVAAFAGEHLVVGSTGVARAYRISDGGCTLEQTWVFQPGGDGTPIAWNGTQGLLAAFDGQTYRFFLDGGMTAAAVGETVAIADDGLWLRRIGTSTFVFQPIVGDASSVVLPTGWDGFAVGILTLRHDAPLFQSPTAEQQVTVERGDGGEWVLHRWGGAELSLFEVLQKQVVFRSDRGGSDHWVISPR